MYSSISTFNDTTHDQVIKSLEVCAPISSWAKTVADGRPYRNRAELLEKADIAARQWSTAEVMGALDSHSKLGQKPTGTDSNSIHSRKEQSSMGTLDKNVTKRLQELQDAYYERFGHIFLIRASGRSASEILEILEVRLTRTIEEEQATTAEELRQIALLRLEQIIQD